MTRQEKLNKYLRYWQIILNLQPWKLSIKLVDFHRPDWPQSGDIEVDLEKKSATVLITKNETAKDSSIILHELLHLILWEYDHFSEQFIPEDKRKEYFTLLEKTVADLHSILLQKER